MIKKIEPSKTNKKVAIVSLGARISLSANNVRYVDLKYMRDYLMHIMGREQVDYVSKKTKKEEGLEYYKDVEFTDLNDYDEIYIYNATFNLFGGVFSYHSLLTFEKLYSFDGDMYYFQIDPKMPNMDFSKQLQGRNKDNSYIFKCDSKSCNYAYKMDPTLINTWSEKVYNNIKIAFDGIDYEKYCNMWNNSLKNKETNPKVLNENVEWFSMFIAEYYAVNEELDLKLTNYNKIDNPYELVYFGNNRQNERNKIIKSLYDIPEYKKFCIGFDPNIQNMDYMDYVKHDELFKLIGEKCLATVVVGDTLHNGNIKSARFFEAMLLDTVAFIYIKYDPERSYVKNEWLKDFIYISSKEELQDRINKVKVNPELYKKIVELERQEIIIQYGNLKKD